MTSRPQKSRKLSASSTPTSSYDKGKDPNRSISGDGPIIRQPEESHVVGHASSSESSDDSDSDDSDLQEITYEDMLKEQKDSDDNVEDKNNGTKTVDGNLLPFGMSDIQEARTFLKIEGSMMFLDKYLPARATGEDIVKLTMLLGYYPQDIKDYNNENNLVKVIKNLQKAMNKVLSMRARLTGFNTIDEAAEKIKSSKNILVLTGAGISTSLGIPDFRSSKGFYSMLSDMNLSDPQEVFDLNTFREDPSIFYSIAHMVLPPEDKYTPLHAFIKLLQDKNKLLRNYTQNIDNLEGVAGISPDKIIQCHGSFATATCRTCKFKVPGNKIFPEIRNKELPICPNCSVKRKRLADNDKLGYDLSYGVMKPDITFFGEDLPQRFHESIKRDIRDCDLLICVGTSLKVAPVSEIVNKVPESVPQILINKDPVTHCEFDVSLLGYCDQVASYLCKKMNWKLPHDDFNTIANSGLECADYDKGSGMYVITNKKQRDEEAAKAQEEKSSQDSEENDK
ncbi:NAD-dependent histone deacetylase [Saccharomycopsis crataegensis]|uniref:NAD-dependent histone deacetylase n=1 Tax=Saccharomycopsis crataegensis TaxID=43959 RepID=A0AAV5QQN6_9ASCO|nr:NAD-dependent histone deacetylase [Saccharomycopsis crataegensis]